MFSKKPADETTGQIVWAWHFTNYGKTPALHVSFHQFMTIENRREGSYGVTPAGSTGAPLPTSKDDFSSVVSQPGVTPVQFRRLMATDEAIGVSGEITYFGAYGQKYETTFCLRHLAHGAILYCREGNDIK